MTQVDIYIYKAIHNLLLPKRRVTIASMHDSGGKNVFIPSIVTKSRTLKIT